MYAAHMTYSFIEDKMDQALEIWKNQILEPISRAPGFQQVIMLRGANGSAVAVGIWDSRESAESFMKTSAARDLFGLLSPFFQEKPRHENMILEARAEAMDL